MAKINNTAFIDAGALPISFLYGSRKISGIPAEFNPVAKREYPDSAITLYTVTGRNTDGLEIKVVQTVYADYPVTETIAYLTNRGTANTPVISELKIFDSYYLPCENPYIIHGLGDECSPAGYGLDDYKLTEPLCEHPYDHSGTPCCGASPYIRLYSKSDNYGYNLAIGWTGLWQADFVPCEGGVKLSVGQRRFASYIKPGETMRTPMLTLMTYEGCQYTARNTWRRWFIDHILPREDGKPMPPKICMHVFGDGGPEFSGTTEVNQIDGLEKYARGGIAPDFWWFDAGWYKCDFNWPYTGTWAHDVERFPRGLGPIGEKCHEIGAKLLLWFEPERVHQGTELANEHSDWILYRTGENNREHNGLLNMGNPEANTWITNRIDSLIKNYHVGVYRQDFNYDPMPNWIAAETEGRVGAPENLHVQGYLRYWDTLKERNPGLIIDSCASGGRRNDLDTMRRAIPLQYTDVGLGVHPLKQIQHRYMFEWIPYFRAHTLNFDDGTVDMPNSGQYNSSAPTDRYSYHCAMAPAITVMTDRNDTERFPLTREMNKIWRRVAELELSCDYIPLTVCRRSNEDWYAMQFDSPERGEGFFQAVRNTLSPDESYTLNLKVDPEALYALEEPESGKKFTVDGKSLASFTITLPKRSGVIYFYRKLS
jgi:Alpha-galactosidase